jgi:hypothetical protein
MRLTGIRSPESPKKRGICGHLPCNEVKLNIMTAAGGPQGAPARRKVRTATTRRWCDGSALMSSLRKMLFT